MIYLFLAFLCGIFIVVSRVINFKLSQELSTLNGVMYNNIVGFIAGIFLILLTGDYITLSAFDFTSIPPYIYAGGVIGAIIIIINNYITNKISNFYITLLTFIGQLVFATIIDYFLGYDISIMTIIGILLVIIGLSYNMKIDYNQDKK